jgi:hypothetical protein
MDFRQTAIASRGEQLSTVRAKMMEAGFILILERQLMFPPSASQAERRPAQLPALVVAMLRPDFYAHRPRRVELIQTHISYVFAAGRFVFKLKKPVRFSFLDFSRRLARLHFCREEVRLNSRISPSIYLGVFPVLRRDHAFRIGTKVRAQVPRAEDYLVKMRRLPPARFLDRLLAAKRVSPHQIQAIADRLVRFHRRASVSRAWKYGSATAVRKLTAGNLAECRRFIGRTVTRDQFEAIGRYMRTFAANHKRLLNIRARSGYVREGHGDLRCEHICLTGGRIEIFDCVEFSEALRYGDIASEIGFLAMDLDRLGAPRLADELVASYASIARDDSLALLVPFYKCHRAVVRAKVEALRSLEPEVPADERAASDRAARGYFELAARYALSASPAIIVVCGMSGTGKSTVARLLHARLGFAVMNSDRIRKRLAAIPAHRRVRTGYGEGIYNEVFTRRTYATMLAEAGAAARAGRGVILDATFKRERERALVGEFARRQKLPVLFVECVAAELEVLRRLRRRASRMGEVSDATAEVYLRQRREFAPLREIPPDYHLEVDTTAAPEQIASEVEQRLERLLAKPAVAGTARRERANERKHGGVRSETPQPSA